MIERNGGECQSMRGLGTRVTSCFTPPPGVLAVPRRLPFSLAGSGGYRYPAGVSCRRVLTGRFSKGTSFNG